MRRAGLSAWSGGMICLPNRKRACAVSSMRDFVRKRIGAPLTIIVLALAQFQNQSGHALLPTRTRPRTRRRVPPAAEAWAASAPPHAASTGQRYLNRLSSVCGAWLASDSACVPSCWRICSDCSCADSCARLASTSAPRPAFSAVDLVVVVADLVGHIVGRGAVACSAAVPTALIWLMNGRRRALVISAATVRRAAQQRWR